MSNLIKFAAGVMLLFALAYSPEAFAPYHSEPAPDPQPAVQADPNDAGDQSTLDANNPGMPDTGAGGSALDNMLLIFAAVLMGGFGFALGVRPTEKS